MADKTKNKMLYGSEAELLIRELGEPDAGSGTRRFGIEEMTEVWEEKDLMDPFRFLLIDFVSEVAGFARAAGASNTQEAAASAGRLMELLSKLSSMPGHGNAVLIRHRGRETGPSPADHDYVIDFGPMDMDMAQAATVVKRLGSVAAHRTSTLRNAFSSLAEGGIRTARFALDMAQETHLGLRVLAAYLNSIGITGKTPPGSPQGVFFISDENNRPDPNLTLCAAVNRMDKNTARTLVEKIHVAVEKAGPSHPLAQFPNVYEACFAFKKLRESLKRSPIEINNARWLVAAHDWEMVPAHRARLARLAADAFGPGSAEPARTMDALYAGDYGSISPRVLSERLARVSRFIKVLEQDGRLKDKLQAVLADTGTCMDLVQDNIFDEFWILADRLELKISERESEKIPVDPRVLDLFAFYSQRSITKQKVCLMAREEISFKERDYQTIARDFGFSVAEARDLVHLLKGCFDSKGRFIKSRFEDSIPAFAEHQAKVFEFLWHYLKEHLDAGERIAFLNGLLRLIDRINRPHGAIRVLLEDFARDPETVRFTDRNALMLANALLRTFNKELDHEIEMTPEEVLKVRQGLDQRAVRYAARLIDDDRQRYFKKMRSIDKKIKDALDPHEGTKPMPLGYLLTLAREAYIFLSLVGGVTGLAVLRSALREYGRPDSGIYHLKKSRASTADLLQLLQVVVRAVARVGEKEDWKFLARMESRAPDFMALDKSPASREQARRTLDWLHRVLKEKGA